MDEVLSSTLREAVYERLNYLTRLASEGDTRSRAALADTEIRRLAAAWRAVLRQHEPDDKGRCPQCSAWRRPRAFPCSVWKIAHAFLITPDPAPRTRRGSRTTAGP